MIILRQMLQSAIMEVHTKDNLLLEDQGKIPFPVSTLWKIEVGDLQFL